MSYETAPRFHFFFEHQEVKPLLCIIPPQRSNVAAQFPSKLLLINISSLWNLPLWKGKAFLANLTVINTPSLAAHNLVCHCSFVNHSFKCLAHFCYKCWTGSGMKVWCFWPTYQTSSFTSNPWLLKQPLPLLLWVGYGKLLILHLGIAD